MQSKPVRVLVAIAAAIAGRFLLAPVFQSPITVTTKSNIHHRNAGDIGKIFDTDEATPTDPWPLPPFRFSQQKICLAYRELRGLNPLHPDLTGELLMSLGLLTVTSSWVLHPAFHDAVGSSAQPGQPLHATVHTTILEAWAAMTRDLLLALDDTGGGAVDNTSGMSADGPERRLLKRTLNARTQAAAALSDDEARTWYLTAIIPRLQHAWQAELGAAIVRGGQQPLGEKTAARGLDVPAAWWTQGLVGNLRRCIQACLHGAWSLPRSMVGWAANSHASEDIQAGASSTTPLSTLERHNMDRDRSETARRAVSRQLNRICRPVWEELGLKVE